MLNFHKFKLLLSLPQDENGLSLERRAVLSSRLMVLILTVTAVYYVIDKIINANVANLIFVGVMGASLLILFLNGLGYFKISKIGGFLFFNFILYAVSSSDPYDTGTHLHLITTGFVALVIFGYEERALGIFFILLSFVLYLVSYFSEFSILEPKFFNPNQTRVFFFINCVVFAIINIYLVVMILRLNYKVEQKLRATNIEILQRNYELTKANAELDRFVYSASHDLRAPLSSITGLISLQKLDPSGTETYLNMMEGRIQVMDKFIHDIIDYSRNTRLDVIKDKIRLTEMVNEIVEVLRFTQENDRLKIQVKVDADLEIISDASRLRVVLNNLISNAIKYSDHSKANPYVIIVAYRQKDRYTIEVKDNGIGIEEELQPKIFEMFFRATSHASGSGLGLYIVKESLEKIGGLISFESKPREGSTFRLALPL